MIGNILASAVFDRAAPWIFGILIAVGIAAIGFSIGWSWQGRIKDGEIAAYKLEQAELERATERARELDRIRRAERSEVIVEEHIVEVEKIRTVYRNITKEVTVYVPSDSCVLPPGWRLLHDAAAEGRDPLPAGSPDVAPVPAQDAATTVIENYESCRVNAERLEGLQQWVREVAGDPK